MRISYLSAILVLLFTSCSTPEVETGRLAFVGPGTGTEQVTVGDGASFEVTVNNDGSNRALGKLQFVANGSAADGQLIDLKAGKTQTFSFYDRTTTTGMLTYVVNLFQGKKMIDSRTFTVRSIAAPTADLGWVSATITPSQALSDTTIHVNAVARNFGAVAAFATVELRVQSAATTQAVAREVVVGRFSLPTMQPGVTAVVNADVSVFGAIDGSARLVLQASAPDTDGTNDTIDVGALQVEAMDWSIELAGPFDALSFSPIAVTAVVANQTDFTLPAHVFTVFQGVPEDPAAKELVTIDIPSLPAGTGVIVSFFLDTPVSLSMDANTTNPIFALLNDPVASNNIGKSTVSVYNRLPDLSAVSVTASTHSAAGGMQLSVSARFANDGSDPTLAPYEIWLTGPSASLLLKTQLPGGTMFAHTAQNLVTTVTLPPLANGAYALRVTLDAERKILEYHEDNNTAVDPIPVVVAPDLVSTILSLTPASTASTSSVNVSVQWSNLGNPSMATSASLWMVSGATEKAQDFITTVTVPALAYQEVSTSTFTLQPLRGAGTYTWVVSAATVPSETVWANNRYQTSATQFVTSSFNIAYRTQLPNASSSSPAWADTDGDLIAEYLLGVGSLGGNGGLCNIASVGMSAACSTSAGESWGSPAVADIDGNLTTELLAGSSTGQVYAMRATDSVNLWQVNLGNRVVYPPALVDMDGDLNLDVVVTAGGRTDGVFAAGSLVVLNGLTGATLWSLDEATEATPHEILAPPAVGDLNGDTVPDVVLEAGSATAGGYLAVIDGSTHGELWRIPTTSRGFVGGAVIVPDSNADGKEDIFAADLNGGVGILAGDTGTVVWSTQVAGYSFYTSPAVGNVSGTAAPEMVVVGQSNAAPNSVIVFVGGALGEQWRFVTPGVSAGAPVIVDLNGDGLGEIVVPVATVAGGAAGTGYSKILVFNGDGSRRDVYESIGSVTGAPAMVDAGNPGFWNLGFSTAYPAAFVEVATPFTSGTVAQWPKFRGNLKNTARFGD